MKIGTMLSEIPHSSLPVLLHSAGLDFFIIDAEHGGFDYAAIGALVLSARLAGISVYIRLADNGRKDITKYMDMGADGLILPMTNTKKEIEQVISYAKYTPIGKRGISTMRAHTLYSPGKLSDYIKEANERTHVFAQIETAMGVDNVADILTASGLSGIFIGPNDLSCDLGCLDDPEETILNTIEIIADAANTAGKSCGIITANKNYINKGKEKNLTYFCCGSELSLLKDAVVNMKKETKSTN